MEVRIGGPTSLAADDVVAVARYGAPVSIHPDALARMTAMRAHVEAKRDADEVVYGITTGFGALATVHVPRRFYVEALPGIPTIRVFEALACGIPLVSAPWSNCEGLFRAGEDFLVARDRAEMTRYLRFLRHDPELRAALVESGLGRIRAHHTCAHRVDELLAIAVRLASRSLEVTE